VRRCGGERRWRLGCNDGGFRLRGLFEECRLDASRIRRILPDMPAAGAANAACLNATEGVVIDKKTGLAARADDVSHAPGDIIGGTGRVFRQGFECCFCHGEAGTISGVPEGRMIPNFLTAVDPQLSHHGGIGPRGPG